MKESKGNWIGIALTVLIHVGAAAYLVNTPLKTLDPPPVEDSFVLSFEEMPQPVEQHKGNEPKSEHPDKTKPIQLVQKKQSPDVPKPVQKEAPELDPRASFPGMANADTNKTPDLGSGTASLYKEGHPDGNTAKGNLDGTPNAHLKGRKTQGNLPRPEYKVQESGIVIVSIWVDQYGTVKKAVAGADGTTVTDKTLWAAARKAAMETHFNMSANAPTLQEGTITYVFNLK